MGEQFVEWACSVSDAWHLIGVELYKPGIGAMLSKADKLGLSNLSFIDQPIQAFLSDMASEGIDEVRIFFPDPWPKKRHADRRFINQENLDTLSRIMRDGAELRFASDEMGYIRWTLKQVRGHPDFEWTAETGQDWKGRPDDWPPTRYEGKALAAGRSCIYLRFRRRIRTNVERCG